MVKNKKHIQCLHVNMMSDVRSSFEFHHVSYVQIQDLGLEVKMELMEAMPVVKDGAWTYGFITPQEGSSKSV